MKNRKILYGLLIVIALSLLGVGYAAISRNLAITGTITSPGATEDDLQVYFDESIFEEQVPVKCGVTLDASKTTATILTEELTTVGDTAIAYLRIVNASVSLSAIIEEISCQLDDSQYSKYFSVSVSSIPDDTTLLPNNTVTVTVTVELISLPVEQKTVSFAITYKATATN